MKRGSRVKLVTALAAVACLVTAMLVVALWAWLRASLPRLDGVLDLPGLDAPVRIERDDLGVPTLHAANRSDAAFGLGFLHAQERFFQMDLLRRSGAGELAELFGPALADHDRTIRRHGFRRTARTALDRLPAYQRAILVAYSQGVQAGLEHLRARPPEYVLLRTVPAPWQPEDAFLVACAMFLTLQDSKGHKERAWEVLHQALPKPAADFFAPVGSAWDAALDGSILQPAAIPDPTVLDFRRPPDSVRNRPATLGESEVVPGSNAWGVPGVLTSHGGAILANEMHLDLGVPNTWFRARLRWHTASGEPADIVGVTLPGVPVVVVGSNGQIAWTFTNANLDTSDVIRVEFDPQDPTRYRTPEGWRHLETVHETIQVLRGPPQSFTFQQTLWGPWFPGNASRPGFALAWVPHQPDALNFDLLDLELARSVSEALDIAPRCGAVPVQNLLVGDRTGTLGWTLIGRLPKRTGFTGLLPVSWADGSRCWDGWLEASELPRILSQGPQRLWTANQRILGSTQYLRAGPWNADLGARARQIREGLHDLQAPIDETDCFSLFADDRAHFLERWRGLLLRTLANREPGPESSGHQALLPHLTEWSGRADTESVGYRIVRLFRSRVMERVLEPVAERSRTLDPAANLPGEHREQPVWTLLQHRPDHLLNPRFPSYDALLLDAIRAVSLELQALEIPLDQATWGRFNTVRFRHPLSLAVPALGRWLNLPDTPLPGDRHMPRVQSTTMGASQRLVVAPGREDQGFFHMPGGQSGHFLSRFYRAGHQAWVDLQPTPLLPGPTRHTLHLRPTPHRGAP